MSISVHCVGTGSGVGCESGPDMGMVSSQLLTASPSTSLPAQPTAYTTEGTNVEHTADTWADIVAAAASSTGPAGSAVPAVTPVTPEAAVTELSSHYAPPQPHQLPSLVSVSEFKVRIRMPPTMRLHRATAAAATATGPLAAGPCMTSATLTNATLAAISAVAVRVRAGVTGSSAVSSSSPSTSASMEEDAGCPPSSPQLSEDDLPDGWFCIWKIINQSGNI